MQIRPRWERERPCGTPYLINVGTKFYDYEIHNQ